MHNKIFNNQKLSRVSMIVLLGVVASLFVAAPSQAVLTSTKVTITFKANSATLDATNQAKLSTALAGIKASKGKLATISVLGFTRKTGATLKDKSFLNKRVNVVSSAVQILAPGVIILKKNSGRVNSLGAPARKVEVTFVWNKTSSPAPTPTPTPTTTPVPTVPAAPTGLLATGSDKKLQISFVAPLATGVGTEITGYEYLITGSTSWAAATALASPIVISNLTNGITYSVQIRAINALGAGLPSLSVTGTPIDSTPSAPTNLVATAGSGKLMITFTPGFAGGSPISNYEYSLDGGGAWNAFNPAQITSPLTISGLIGGNPYTQVKIRAVNANGAGVASASVSGTPTVSVPSAPTNLVVTPGDSSLSIAFTPAASNGSAITNYQYSLDGGVTFTSFLPVDTVSPLVITGLANGTTYTAIKLRAVSTIGFGLASSTISGTPAVPASAPTGISVVPSSGGLIVSFTPGNSGGATITNYQYSLDSGYTWRAISPADGLSPIAITGLVNGSTYPALRIRAVTASGPGDPSEIFSGTPVAPATAPSAPAVITITPGAGSISIGFVSGSTGGSPITNYEYQLTSNGTWIPFSPQTTSSPLVISGLSNGTYNQIRIRAVNAIGVSSSVTLAPIVVSGG